MSEDPLVASPFVNLATKHEHFKSRISRLESIGSIKAVLQGLESGFDSLAVVQVDSLLRKASFYFPRY